MTNLYTHQYIYDYLVGLYEDKKLNNQYIFSGQEGIGKKTLAIELSKKILNDEYLLTNADFLIINEKDIIKVENIYLANKFLNEKPIVSENKILIIDDVHNMNEASSNKFLKTFEEVPSYAYVFLITSEKNKLLDTIVSRAVVIDFKNNTRADILSYFNNKNLKFVANSIGLTKKIIEDENLLNIALFPINVIDACLEKNELKIIDFSNKIQKDYVSFFLNSMLNLFRDILVTKLKKDSENIYYYTYKIKIEEYATIINDKKIENIINIIFRSNKQISSNCSKDIVLFNTLINIYREFI